MPLFPRPGSHLRSMEGKAPLSAPHQHPPQPSQPLAPQLLWCFTTGCLGSGPEGAQCRRCRWTIRDHSKYKTITLSSGAQALIENTRYDEENKWSANLNKMRAAEEHRPLPLPPPPAIGTQQISGQEFQQQANHAAAMHEQWRRQRAEEQQRKKVEEEKERRMVEY